MKSPQYLIIALLLLIAACGEKKQTLFVAVPAADSGILFNNAIVETDSFNILTDEYIFNGGGVAVGDFNNDGLPDLYFTGNQVGNKLYLNEGNFKFKDITDISGTEAGDRWSTGVTVVDINGDGWLDIYVCAAMYKDQERRKNMLFVNQGLNENGIPFFKESAAAFGIAESGNSMMATFFDYDLDGDLDLYVLNNEQSKSIPSNYRDKIVDGSAINNDKLYRNDGDGKFTDVTIEAGITIEGFGLGIAVADVNYDGWPDLHISNDYITNDILYINNQDGTFTNKIGDFIRHQSMFSMGSDIADYNNDGFVDLITIDMLGETNFRKKTTISKNSYQTYINNITWGYEFQHVRNMLHVGNGSDTPFSEIGYMAGVYQTDWSWSPLFVDVNNDGKRDLLITNGFPRDITDKDFANYRSDVGSVASVRQLLDSIPIIKIPNYAFQNEGDWTFSDKGADWGLNKASFSNGAVFADLDGDGDLDYVVNNINDPAFVFKNTLINVDSKSNFLRVKLEGTQLNPQGIGTKLVLRAGDGSFQYHEHYLTRGYMSAVEDIVHFGLGTDQLLSLEVLWPDGKYQVIKDLAPNQVLSISYKSGNEVVKNELDFPLGPKSAEPLLALVGENLGLGFVHQEEDKIDYNVQRTLPHKLTQFGPTLVTGDINGDGLEDLLVGSSAGYSPVVFTQKADGSFESNELFASDAEKRFEEMGMLLVDLDGDGDLDLYLVSGSSEFLPQADEYQDRIYLNDGKGNFQPSTINIPSLKVSGTVVRSADLDGDGFPELFVGGRTPIAQYPLADQSVILKFKKGEIEDVTDKIAPGLRNIGMVTDAIWTDVNADGALDLVVVGELMPITVFVNKGGQLHKATGNGLDKHFGWWNSIVAGDFDQDGDMDYVVGNLGANNNMHPSEDRPVQIWAKDFDNNNSVDPVTFVYFKDNSGQYKSVPAHYWDDLYGQSPLFRRKFTGYKHYATATQSDFFTTEEMEGATQFTGNYDKTSYLENLGNGTFKIHELPLLAQTAPVNGMVVTDVNHDGVLDILMVGNDYGNEVFSGRYDAFNGLVLLGDGTGNWRTLRAPESGFLVAGDAKSMAILHLGDGTPLYLSTQNRGALLVHRPKSKDSKNIKIPAGIHTLILELENGKKQRIEVFNRSGFLSNSGSFISLDAKVKKVEGIDYNGKTSQLYF
jgi:enediyne biosynthesis protein E4